MKLGNKSVWPCSVPNRQAIEIWCEQLDERWPANYKSSSSLSPIRLIETKRLPTRNHYLGTYQWNQVSPLLFSSLCWCSFFLSVESRWSCAEDVGRCLSRSSSIISSSWWCPDSASPHRWSVSIEDDVSSDLAAREGNDVSLRHSSFFLRLEIGDSRTTFVCDITCQLCDLDFKFTSDLFTHLSSNTHRERIRRLDLTHCA